MAEGKFFFNWEEFQTTSSERFQHLVGNKDFSDVTLVAGDGRRIFGHQVILGTGCTFFRTLLGEERSPKPLIFLRGFEATLVESLVDFLYTGKAEVNEELVTKFLALAEDLGVEGLATNISHTGNEIGKQKDNEEHLKEDVKLISTLDWTGLEGPNKQSLERANAQRSKSNQNQSRNQDLMLGDKKIEDKVQNRSDSVKHEISDEQIVNPGRNGLFRCNLCERTIKFRHNFKRHIRLRHKNPTKPSYSPSELIRMSRKSEDGLFHH